MHAPVRYAITPQNPSAHLYAVRMQIDRPNPEGQRLSLPAWIPGSYMIREFAKNVVQIRASDDRGPVALQKLDKDTWQAAPATGALVVEYEVYAWDLSVRTAHLDATHGFFNGTSVFLSAHGLTEHPHAVQILPPEGAEFADWRVATTLPRHSGEAWTFGDFLAHDYDALLDHPVELGTFDLLEFEACGVPHYVALTGIHRCDTERLVADLVPICEHHIRFFGEPAPVERYLFLVMIVGNGYGGLEHRDSTALICKRSDLPVVGDPETSDGYRNFLGLCSHEYFHTWNVKRIKPKAFVPYDLSRESHSTLLWAFEGITSYYDDLGLLRSGRIDTTSWLELVGRTITRVYRTSGRLKQSLADSSFDAWTKFYRQDENAPNAIVSYYAKGSLVALALDLHLRAESGDAVHLDALMQAMWERYGDGSGVDEGGVEALASELLGSPLQSFFDQAIRGTEDLPLAELLSRVGVKLNWRTATGHDDKGGKAAKKAPSPDKAGDFGATTAPAKGGVLLKQVHDGGAAQAAGLSAGDVVIALDGLKVDRAGLQREVRSRRPGTVVKVHAFRRDELRTYDVELLPPPETTAWLSLDDEADEVTVARRKAWLEGATRAQ